VDVLAVNVSYFLILRHNFHTKCFKYVGPAGLYTLRSESTGFLA
jgi:hypothetical protein